MIENYPYTNTMEQLTEHLYDGQTQMRATVISTFEQADIFNSFFGVKIPQRTNRVVSFFYSLTAESSSQVSSNTSYLNTLCKIFDFYPLLHRCASDWLC